MIIWVLIGSTLSALIAGGGSYLISRKILKANSEIFLEQSKAKAKAIEHEAEKVLQESKIKAKELELQTKQKCDEQLAKSIKDYENNLLQFEKQKLQEMQKLDKESCFLAQEKQQVKQEKNRLCAEQNSLQSLKDNYHNLIKQATDELSNISGLSKKQAQEKLLEKVEIECRKDIAKFTREIEEQARANAKNKANYILAQATSRFAGEFAAERLIHTITLPSDDVKAKIIGKEGRNIKALELTCGVDIIIDDTPGVIIVSSHNLYRRSIAVRTIEMLVEDGRIHPAKIEEIYQKCSKDFEDSIYEEGEKVVLDLGIGNMHPEIKKLIGKLRYRASYGQNALAHSLEVANLAGIIAAELGGDCLLATRAGLLHDIGKSRTHDFKGTHVELGAEIARRYNEPAAVLNAILCHHGDEEIKSIEAAAVCAADAVSAGRPGARREVLENYLRRVSELENIALSKMGVLHAYAINAGREIRVIVQSEKISDDESYLLAKEIAKDIESSVQYPGAVKVSVIRETRSCAIAS